MKQPSRLRIPLCPELRKGSKEIRQVYGKNDRSPTKEELQKVRDFVDTELGAKHDYFDPDAWVPN